MNVLHLAHRIPYPPDKGDKLRAFRQIERLAGTHRVWSACFVDTPSDAQYLEPLSAYCRDVAAVPLNRTRAMIRGLAGLARGRTLTETFYQNNVMVEALHRWAASIRFDAIVAFSSSMAPYALAMPTRRRVLDLCDLDSRKWLDYAKASHGPARWAYKTEGLRLAVRERAWLEQFDATILITDAEAAGLRESPGTHKVHVVGNGVALPELHESHTPASGPPTVGFVGVMDYRPNVDAVTWFAATCWPQIRKAHPNAVFRIAGRRPTRCVRRLGRRPGVEVVGEVEDIQAELRRFDVSVAPMRIARGLQNKVLEAMATGRPVVLTGRAAEGIKGRHAHEFLVADTPHGLAETVIRLLQDPVERHRIGLAAYRFVAAHHRWERELDRFEMIVTGTTSPTSRPRTRHSASTAGSRADRAVSIE